MFVHRVSSSSTTKKAIRSWLSQVLPSDVLGLELHLIGQAMRFCHLATQQFLFAHLEEASARQTAEDCAQTG